MASSLFRARTRVVVPSVIALVALVGAPVLLAGPGAATPRLTIGQVEAQVSALNAQADAANEQRNEYDSQAAATSALAAKVRARIAAQDVTLAKTRAALGVFASAAYQSGGVDSTLQLMLSDNPANFLEQTASLDVVARGQQAALLRVAAAQQQLDQSKAELAQTLAQQNAALAAAAAQSNAINAKVAQAQHLLDSLQAAQRRELEAQQAAQAAAAARASQAALRATARYATHPASTGGSSGYSGGSYTGPASGRASVAVAFARAQVGKRYVWGASGPDAYDCSGLTMAAWAAAGVSLPHYTVAQYAATRHVSLSDVEPGDLLLFGPAMQHVGIYVGGGVFVQAEGAQWGVVATPLAGYWGSQVSGVGRP